MAEDRKTVAYAARDNSGLLSPFSYTRREVGANDVEMKVLFCGMCHSDVHQIRNEWMNATYPMVPGHEVVGVVSKVGKDVSRFSLGDKIGIGCMVRSCHSCDACSKDLEQFCGKCVFTYNSVDWATGEPTYGGYGAYIVCDQSFVLRMPDSLPLSAAAPLLCAGITVYSPLVHFGMNQPGKTLGVVGLGGLGHMAVKIAKAMGLIVVVLSTSPSKKDEAITKLGADQFLVTKDSEAVAAAAGSLDFIIDTVSAPHPLTDLLNLLKVDGKLVVVGVPPEPAQVPAASLIFGRKLIAGSLIGGIKETQEMLDFCAEKNVLPLVENIKMDYVNTAIDRMLKNDVRYRFVIDVEDSFNGES